VNDKLPLSRAQRVVRVVGALLLFACAWMVILGTTIWEDDLHGPRFALYWSWCFLLALAALVTALWDVVLVRRAFYRQRRELFRQQFMRGDWSRKPREERQRPE
jgi:TRAP-type C4-dicarboxylate transport system permease small subunit